MPMYEYKCRDCDHTSEALRPMSDADAAIDCEACGSKETGRIHSVFSPATSQSGGDTPPMGDCSQCCGEGGSCPYKP